MLGWCPRWPGVWWPVRFTAGKWPACQGVFLPICRGICVFTVHTDANGRLCQSSKETIKQNRLGYEFSCLHALRTQTDTTQKHEASKPQCSNSENRPGKSQSVELALPSGPATHNPGKSPDMVACACDVSTGRRREEDLWGSLSCWGNPIGELQANE